MKALTVESEYGKELFVKMKKIRDAVKQRIKKSQRTQKDQYDKHVKESKIRIGDLVMLKVEASFKLDRTFRGPYRVHAVTSTCACIQPINSPDAEKIYVSLQRLSRCHGTMLDNVTPWLGHGKTRKRRQIRPRQVTDSNNEVKRDRQVVSTCEQDSPMTRSGRRVKKPARYRVNSTSCPEGSASQQGGSCKGRARDKQSVEREHVRTGVWIEECEHEATDWKVYSVSIAVN